MDQMTNKERMIATFKREETDYTPMHLEINQSYEVHDVAKKWKNQFERTDFLLSLGVDAAIELWLPNPSMHPDVKVYEWKEVRPGEKYTLLCKQYDTPEGPLRQVIKETEDLYDYWHINKNTLGKMHTKIGGVGMIEDVNPSRSVEFLIKGPDDLKKMKYLFQPAHGLELEKWKETAKYCKNEAEKRNVLFLARRLHCGSDLVWLTDVINSVYAMNDNPEYIGEFLQIIEDWQISNLSLALDAGVDVVTRFGYYDIPDFWGVEHFEKHLAGKLNQEADLCHQAGVFLSQQQSKGLTQLVDVYKDVRVDILRDVDPVQGFENLAFLKKELGDKKTFWGGVNLIDIALKGEENFDVDGMVLKAFEDLGQGGGFVLYPVTGVYVEVRWNDVLRMIEAWKKYRTMFK